MNFRNRMFSKENRKIFLVIIIFLILITLNRFFLKEIKNVFYNLTLPIQKVFWEKGEKFSGFFQTLFELRNVKIENQELLKQNQKLLSLIGEIKDLKKENRDLREALGLKLQKDFELVSVRTISKETEGDFILISKGTDEGISQGMPVITKEKVIVGSIDKVYKNFSRVLLLSNKKNSFDVEITSQTSTSEEDKIYGLAQGEGNLKIRLKLVPQDKELRERDLVFTSLLAGVFPKGLLVGEIRKVEKNDLAAFQEAVIEPYFKKNLSEILFVIKNFIPKKETE